MRRTGRTPIDDDAEKTEIRPLEASMPLSIMGTLSETCFVRHPPPDDNPEDADSRISGLNPHILLPRHGTEPLFDCPA